VNPADFWKPWEETADSFAEVVSFIDRVRDPWVEGKGMSFAWRGVVHANWALDSSLYRRLAWTHRGATYPDEMALFKAEDEIMVNVHRWGLHWSEGRRLPWLLQMAMLQHYGAPTRLIDITFNAWIGVWFAVEQKWANGVEKNQNDDGRLFAMAVNNLIINEQPDLRSWEDQQKRPWPKPTDNPATAADEQKAWTASVYAWRPPHIDGRIAAQNGGFLIGGVPDQYSPGNKRRFWPKTHGSGDHWTIDEVRCATSVATRPHRLNRKAGRIPKNPMFTLRIKASAKEEIRRRLANLYGYEHRTIYPDFPGFASFGTPSLKQWP
jgi:hypothetical protein